MSVLIVNDRGIRRHVRGMLERERFDPIWEAGDAVTAFVLARTHEPDIVILDSLIPETEAAIVVSALRSVVPLARILVLVRKDQGTPDWANKIQSVELSNLTKVLAEDK